MLTILWTIVALIIILPVAFQVLVYFAILIYANLIRK